MGKRLRTSSYILLFGLLIGGVAYHLFAGNISSIGQAAFGYFAAGDYASGIFASGLFSAGVLSAGVFSIGVFSAGVFSMGIFNVGVLAIGLFATGYRRKKANIRESEWSMSRSKQRTRVRPPIRLNHTNHARGPVAERQPGRGVLGPRQPGRGFFTGAMSLLLLCCFFIGAGKTYAQEPGQLSIRTVAADSYSGFLRVRLARNESEYIGETGAYLEESIPMSGESATVSFRDVEPGRYAVALYLDTDEDGELDTNLFGVPQEPIGFSRNPRIGMSRPGFSETAFDYPGGKLTVDIELKD